MKHPAKRVAQWLLVSGLSGGLAGCGVTSEVATTHPSTSALGAAQPLAPAAGASAGRPHRLPTGDAPVPHEVAHATVVAPAAAMATSAASSQDAGDEAPAAPSPTPSPSAAATRNLRTQSGRIIDEAGQPLVGATVLLKGTTRGASTDANGNYFLTVPLGTNTFVFGYSGYQNEVAQSQDGQPLTVTLLPDPDGAPVVPVAKNPKTRPRKN